jgi:phospholipid/cholesterol/gamma-HCH transport system substrate-binding protein
MRLTRTIKLQLVLFCAITLVAGTVMIFRYIEAPAMLFGIGRYTVTVDLDRAAGLYPNANVTYRGAEVGVVRDVHLTDAGVQADLSLDSDVPITSSVQAQVHSRTAIGEQYVELHPQGDAAPLKDGDVIRSANTSVPPDIDALIDATDRGLSAIPQENLQTVVDESYRAVGGLGPELSRMVNGSTQLAVDADKNLDSLITLIEQSKPILDSQSLTADDIKNWAAHLATISRQLDRSDAAVSPTLSVLLANLVSLGQVAVTYQPAIEQLLVLFPPAVANAQGAIISGLNTKQDYRGINLDFNLNLNLPPVCNTGFLPPQQQRSASLQDYPDRPPGDLFCRVPQDSPFNVRGARNYPCMTVPGKRAPTDAMCESNEQYIPLNDGYNWKGDPNATSSGQDIPQLPPGAAPTSTPTAPITAAQYDPAAGAYMGPDGHVHTQGDLTHPGAARRWQDMLMPPAQ